MKIHCNNCGKIFDGSYTQRVCSPKCQIAFEKSREKELRDDLEKIIKLKKSRNPHEYTNEI